jgi:hypothetical protein
MTSEEWEEQLDARMILEPQENGYARMLQRDQFQNRPAPMQNPPKVLTYDGKIVNL